MEAVVRGDSLIKAISAASEDNELTSRIEATGQRWGLGGWGDGPPRAETLQRGARGRGRPRSRSPADDAAAQRRRADGGEREDEDESEDEDVVQPATTIAGERAAGHGGSGVAATA